jgi:hypothetical protein
VIDPALHEKILRDLDRLPPDLQRRAVELVRSLSAPQPRGASVDDLLSVSGILDEDSAREMREAIEEHCERVESRDW